MHRHSCFIPGFHPLDSRAASRVGSRVGGPEPVRNRSELARVGTLPVPVCIEHLANIVVGVALFRSNTFKHLRKEQFETWQWFMIVQNTD